jgi:hypothetical protein
VELEGGREEERRMEEGGMGDHGPETGRSTEEEGGGDGGGEGGGKVTIELCDLYI